MGHPMHTRACFDPIIRKKAIDWMCGVIEKLDLDAIVVCGQSGLIVGGILSYQLGVQLIAVRKPWERPRGDRDGAGANFHAARVQGPRRDGFAPPTQAPAIRYAFVDDLVDSGTTLMGACRTAKEEGAITCVWPTYVVLYNSFAWKTSLTFSRRNEVDGADWFAAFAVHEDALGYEHIVIPCHEKKFS